MAVLAHCFTCSKDIKAAVRVARALAGAGYGVLRFDFMGLGDSQGNFADSNFSTNCADLLAAIRFVAEQYAPPSLLVGHSFGGAASLAVASEVPSVLGVSTIASPSDTQHLAALLERMNPAIATQGSGEVTIGGRSYLITQQMVADFRAYDMQHTLRNFTKPVLIFHAPGDETLRFSHALRLLEALTRGTSSHTSHHQDTHSLSSLISLPGADHLLTNRPGDVEYVAAMIATWWQRLLV
ncbi:MAG: alpha/beta fold hydrolase [Pirellulaceae bacterium]|nr:alpha/beta fold hydrolase [Pirellulaceae bacterium]